jgi:chromosome segregation ATPase
MAKEYLEEKHMSETLFNAPAPPSGGGVKTAILFGAVIALVAATGYQYYQINQVKAEIEEMRDQVASQISSLHETSAVSTQTAKRTIDALRTQLEQARRQVESQVGQARLDAEKHADELASQLKRAQEDQAQRVAAVASDLSSVRSDAEATKSRVGQVSGEVTNVKTDLASTKAEQEKLIADLKSARGDLGIQSGLIATNSKELAALKALGQRNYTEFKLAKEKTPSKVGDVQIRLKSADPKRNRYTIELIADDKMVEKKDRTVNEPVQFMMARATQPYELVVNDVKKDFISGYLSAPKVQQSRN